jgi:uncharacterized protein
MASILRLLLIAAVIWFVYSWIKRMLTPPQLPTETKTPPLMHQCAYCGVHIPEGESTQSQGQYFCSEAHRDSYLQSKP